MYGFIVNQYYLISRKCLLPNANNYVFFIQKQSFKHKIASFCLEEK